MPTKWPMESFIPLSRQSRRPAMPQADLRLFAN